MKNALNQLVSLIETQIINIRKSIHRYFHKDYQSPARFRGQHDIVKSAKATSEKNTPHYHVALYSEKTPSGHFCPAGRQNNIIPT
jgi:hypothetical protein